MQRELRLTERVAWGIEVASTATLTALYLTYFGGGPS